MKTGELVKCIDNSKYPNFLTIGNVYRVQATRSDKGIDEILLRDNMSGMLYVEASLFTSIPKEG